MSFAERWTALLALARKEETEDEGSSPGDCAAELAARIRDLGELPLLGVDVKADLSIPCPRIGEMVAFSCGSTRFLFSMTADGRLRVLVDSEDPPKLGVQIKNIEPGNQP